MPVSLAKQRSIHVKTRRSLIGIAAALFAAVVISVAVQGQAPPAATGVITGVVQGRKGPKPASGSSPKRRTCRPTSSRSSSPTTRAASWCPSCRPPATASGSAATAWSIPNRSDSSRPPTAMTLRVDAGEDAAGGREGLSRRLLAVDARASRAPSEFPGTGRAGQRHRRRHADAEPLDQLAEVRTATSAISSGTSSRATVDHVFKAKPELKTHAEAWEWRLGIGVRGNAMYSVLGQQGQTRTLKVVGRTGPSASPRARCRRRRRDRRASSATSC